MTYILIMILHYGQAGITAEFSSKEKCELAGLEIAAKNHNNYNMQYYCMEK